MADLAHDASGPASSEPAGITQQVKQPASSDSGKLRVFISYSRDDLKFADQLDAALNACGFECLIDRHGISGGEDWKRRLGNLISEADTVVFVLSPSSARSEICDWEVEEAARLNKRILPVNCRPLEGVSPPPRLRELNYIFLYEEPKVLGSGFGAGLASLITALNTDFDWLREHTRYLQRAIEWDKGGRPANRLLSGNDILEAKVWAAARPKSAPEPTALQLDFIRASEEEAEARLSEQRKQVEAMAAAQAERETALHDREEALKQRVRIARVRNIALVAVTIIAVLAGWFAWRAQQEQATTDHILGRAINIIWDVRADLKDDTKKRVFGLLQMGANHGDVTSMHNLGYSYAMGWGAERDYDKAFEWYRKAADKGNVQSMTDLGALYTRGSDFPEARQWYEKAAKKGDATAMSALGWFYDNGLGVMKDDATAHDYYEKAAAKGNEHGMAGLGRHFHDGRGVARDYAKARDWFEKAADKGHVESMTELGLLYMQDGVTQDQAKAREWFEKAAAKDEPAAMSYLGLIFEIGYGVPQDYAKAREWYEKAAAQRIASAKTALEQLPIHEAATAGRYVEALQRQEVFAAKVEAEETARDGKPGEQTAVALTAVIQYALLTKEFAKALTVAGRSHALIPDSLAIESNRAHALMLMGNGEEARALYLAHKGEPVVELGKLWERAIADDLAVLREAGLTHPMMADIEKELGISR
jgi:TPR repeat protein